MASRREQIVDYAFGLVAAALPNADVKRNLAKAERIAPGGSVILRDGDPGEPDVDLSPLMYNYTHRIPIELAGYASDIQTREQVLDTMLGAIGAAVAADRGFGGLANFAEVEAATSDDLETMGAEPGRWADTAIVVMYATPDPLN